MPGTRIAVKWSLLRDQIKHAIAGAEGEPNWPVTAPPIAEIQEVAGRFSQKLTVLDGLLDQVSLARAEVQEAAAEATRLMTRLDQVTDGLYGPGSPWKSNFGLPPKKVRGASSSLKQAIIQSVSDGRGPASLYVDWRKISGAAAYHVEWYGDSTMIQQVGNAAVSESQYEIAGLVAGKQYWIRVRAIRGGEHGPWSDPGTRIANL